MAIKVTCTVTNLNEFQNAMWNFDEAIKRQVNRQLVTWATLIKAVAESKVPVRLGYLKSSIYAKVKEWVVQIGATATHALFIEFGTKRMAARPYLHPAIQQCLPQLEQLLMEAIEAAKTEVGFR